MSERKLSGDELRRDIVLSRRVQKVCTWCGPAFVVLLFGGWGLLGGFIPLIPPSDSAADVAREYADHETLRQFGLILGMIGVFLTVPFFFAISMQMRRSEGRVPMFAILQFASGLVVCVVLIIPMLLFLGGQFRPGRDPELTRLVNELSYLMLILPWPPIWGQLIAIASQTLTDKRDKPVFPRWSGYYQLWVAVGLVPASMIEFFDEGPFAWNGLIGFWIPAAIFGVWYIVMTVLMLRAIREEEAEDLQALAG
jgi:hypothetical protein